MTHRLFQSFAEREPDIAFTHIWPGAVRTPLVQIGGPSWVSKPLKSLFHTLLTPFTVSPEECGEHMLWALLNGEKGAYQRDNKGDETGKKEYYSSDEAKARVWKHTEQEIKRALESNA